MSESKIVNLERSRSILKDLIGQKMLRNGLSTCTSVKYEMPRECEIQTAPRSSMDFEEGLKNVRCRLGETAVLRCSLSTWSRSTITWLKNSFQIPSDSERISETFDGRCARITITCVQPSDFGCYECVATTTDSKCFTTGTLLLKNSLADSPKDAEAKVEIKQASYNDILRTSNPIENRRQDIKRSVIQIQLEDAKNKFIHQQPQTVEKPSSDLHRKKSFYEINHCSNDFRVEPSLQRSATTIRQKLLEWCKIQLRDYQDVNITNFSSSWNDGLAFCALVHRFCPDAFDFNKLDRNDSRHNFQLAFDTATKHGVTPLLDVEDMVRMKNPDWKCIFMYVESIYRAFAANKITHKTD